MLSYKPHIDGLRAIAVLLVLLFHMNAASFSGGYLGVDIFFVISGFVITQSLYKDYITNGRVDIFQFYLKRFKRLYPALVTMLAGTTVAYFFFGFLWDTNLYLKSAFSAFFATSNIYFLYHGGNYFNEDLINPLVHTWSLGVEEQFYLLYPMLLSIGFIIMRRYTLSTKNIAAIALVTSIILYFIFAFNTETIWGNFYFPLARFWELGFGCALALATVSNINAKYSSWFGVFGILLLAILQIFQPHIGLIQIETGLAVCATLALIYAGLGAEGVIVQFLSLPTMVYIGKLSYSLYLWHLPVIYFANLYVTPDLFVIVVPVVTMLFAMVSFHYIENPLRYSSLLNVVLVRSIKIFPVIIILLVGITLIVGVSSIRTTINDEFNHFGKYIGSINYIEKNFSLGERIQPNYITAHGDCYEHAKLSLSNTDLNLDKKCIKFSTDKKQSLFYLTGDSHALHFVPTLEASSVVQKLLFSQFPTQSIVSKHEDASNTSTWDTLDTQEEELQKLHATNPNIYYVTSLYLNPYKDKADTIEMNLRQYIESLSPYATIIFIAPTPVFTGGPESCVLLGKHCTVVRDVDRHEQQVVREMLERLNAEYTQVFVFDPYPLLCDSPLCFNYIKETDTLVYLDDDHIAPEQSKLLAPAFDAWFRDTFRGL